MENRATTTTIMIKGIMSLLMESITEEGGKRVISLGMRDPTLYSCFRTRHVSLQTFSDSFLSNKFNGYPPMSVVLSSPSMSLMPKLQVRRKAQYYFLNDSITCNLYPFINKLEGHIFVDVVSGEEKVKIQTKHAAFSKKRKVSETNPIQVELSAKDVEKGLNIEGDDDELVMLEPAFRVVDSLINNLKTDEPLKDLENDEPMKDLENPEILPTENKTIKEIGECSKSEKPRKKRGSSNTKA